MTGGGETDAPRCSVETEKDARNPRKAEWGPRDTAWVTWVALLPILLFVVSVAFTAVSGETMIGDVLATWQLDGMIGLVSVVPVMIVSLFGAGALKEQFRFGRRLASLGGAVTVLVFAAFVYGGIAEAVSPDESRDPYSWGPVLSPFASCLAVVPYFGFALANVYVIVHLWRRNA